MEKQKTLTYINELGKEVECLILFTIHSTEFNKDYVLFYPKEQENSDDIELNAASYIETKDGCGELSAIESDEEWEFLEDALEQYDKENGDER